MFLVLANKHHVVFASRQINLVDDAVRNAAHQRGLRALVERHPRFARRCYAVAPGLPAVDPE
jgi:hypothetical protein